MPFVVFFVYLCTRNYNYVMKNIHRFLPYLSTLVVFVSAWLFFGLVYPNHIHFHEQYQMFVYDSDYLSDILSRPGGLADLVGRFLTQFFLYEWGGSCILAALLAAVQCWTARRLGWSKAAAFSLLPAVLLFGAFCEENTMVGSLVAILLSQITSAVIGGIRQESLRAALSVVLTPILYWLVGPLAVLYVLTVRVSVWALITNVVILLVWPGLCQQWVSMSLDNLYLSTHYYRHPGIVPVLLWIATGVMIVLDRLPDWLKGWTRTEPTLPLPLAGIVIVSALGGGFVAHSSNMKAEEVMQYDFLARHQNWNGIIQAANTKAPNNFISVTALNLALGMKGQLGERLFDYHQNGLQGLLPRFDRDPVSPLTTSEVFYHLGMINTAQRFVFEAQEAIPDYQKSARCYKRLAETNLINGSYDVARKYLLVLRKTLYYRRWAERTLALLGHEEAIVNHPEYGHLRQVRMKEDFYFSDQETSQMLGQLLLSNPRNRLAFEYLESSYLLSKNLDSFVQCLGYGNALNYSRMPRCFDQGILLWWSRDHKASEKMPFSVSPDLVSRMHSFYTMMQAQNRDSERIKASFGQTYWYYYFFN